MNSREEIQVTDELAEILAEFSSILDVSYIQGMKILTMKNGDAFKYRALSEMCDNFYEICTQSSIYLIRRETKYKSNSKISIFNYYKIKDDNTASEIDISDAKKMLKISREMKIKDILE